jgi:hypothetical protein
MLKIFQLWGNLITKIVVQWQRIDINGFRPFWYLIGVLLLTVFGFFLRGLLFSGAAGGSVSSIAGKVGIKAKVKGSKSK